MSLLKLSSLSIAIGAFQLASQLIPTAYAATPLKFTLKWDYKTGTEKELNTRFSWDEMQDHRYRYGIHLSLGTPRQEVYLMPNLLENETYVMDPTHCGFYGFCEDSSGGLFAANESSTWNVTKPIGTTTSDEIAPDLWRYVDGNYTRGTEVGEFRNASVNLTLDGLEIGLITGDPNPSTIMTTELLNNFNSLGLGPRSDFLANLKDKEVISERAFGFYDDVFDIGGIDEARIEGNKTTFPIIQNNWGGLQVTVAEMEVNGQSIMAGQQPFEAIISMLLQDNLVPDPIFQKFLNTTGGHNPFDDKDVDYTENYMFYPGWNDTLVPFTNFNLTLTLSNGYKLVAPERSIRTVTTGGPSNEKNLSEPTGYSRSTIIPLVDTDFEDFRPIPDGVKAIFGLAFFNATYLYVDHERGVFELVDAKGARNTTSDGPVEGDTGAASALVRGNFYAWGLVLFSFVGMVVTGGIF